MTNYYKLPEADLYWKIIDEITTVIQLKNSSDAIGVTKTTSEVRYSTLTPNIPKWELSNETEFNSVLAEILNDINN
jgi:hypothetical protein